MRVNLYIMDMSISGNTSGVDRYISMLFRGLSSCQNINVYRINLQHNPATLFVKEEVSDEYTCITVPLPQRYDEIITEKYWTAKYNEQVLRLIKHLFTHDNKSIIHIHTLNLIDLAVLIKKEFGCKIIAHLHCIPWKSLYNTNNPLFNKLYNNYYCDDVLEDNKRYLTNHSELESYRVPDLIICVTNCAKEFLTKCLNIPSQKIIVIPNGLEELRRDELKEIKRISDEVQLLYVGVLSESKGLKYILKSLKIVASQGYNVKLTVAGRASEGLIEKLEKRYHNLPVAFVGQLPFNELQNYYETSDIGVIGSLQEQSSYVAIEMCQYGMPIITTAVDGLDEMFTDGVNALKEQTNFSVPFGLSVDVEQMARQIIKLITNPHLRNMLGVNSRALYEESFSLENMMCKTINAYDQIIGGTNNV